MSWTETQWLEYVARRQRQIADKHEADPGPESDLQGKIQKWAKEHGYPCQCFRQSAKARRFLVVGWPD